MRPVNHHVSPPLFSVAFPIPMRGNEAGAVDDHIRKDATAFPIPMRGNELTTEQIETEVSIVVSDPHEG